MSGAGGSGKTRLAIEVGQQLVSEFADGVWWVDFSALAEGALVAQQIAKALGVQEQPNVALVETLRAHLKAKTLLLILDNCEHLIDACAPLVQALSSNSLISILATSREALNIAGEQIYQVPTLAVPTTDSRRQTTIRRLLSVVRRPLSNLCSPTPPSVCLSNARGRSSPRFI